MVHRRPNFDVSQSDAFEVREWGSDGALVRTSSSSSLLPQNIFLNLFSSGAMNGYKLPKKIVYDRNLRQGQCMFVNYTNVNPNVPVGRSAQGTNDDEGRPGTIMGRGRRGRDRASLPTA